MKEFDLKGTLRSEFGKKVSKLERSSEKIPCVLYGNGENVHFTTSEVDVLKLIINPDVFVVNLDIEGKKCKAIVKEVQFHPVTDKILHIDFFMISEEKPVVVELPVKLEGLAEGVKAGGRLSLEMRKLKVKGIYTKLPERVVIDVTSLGLGKTIQIGNLSFNDFEILNAKNAVVAQVKLTRASYAAAAGGK